MNVLAIAEHRDGALRRVSAEVVTAARTAAEGLGGRVDALVVGSAGLAPKTEELGRYGAEKIILAAHDALESYSPEGYAEAVVQAVKAGDYGAVLFAASAQGKDLAPRVAARLDAPLATEATGLDVEDGDLVVTRPLYSGKAVARLRLEGNPRLVSLRPNVFTPQERPAAGTAETRNVDVQPDQWRVRVRELRAAAGEKLDVAEAPIVVSGGRGLKGPENWGILEELAAAFGDGVALGASRAVVDAGWRPHAEQVGQTGKTVAPKLYVAVGISGAIQHLAGMRTASTIVAINKDPDAPIFKIADYGIVGDAFEVVPRLTDALREGR